MVQIYEAAQDLTPKARIELFRLDTTKVGGGMLFFVQGSDASEKISFGGQQYEAADIEFEGLEVSGSGSLPTPTIRVANYDGLGQSAINTWGELLGCEIRRIRTFKNFLDGQPDEDPTAFFGPDVFLIERKVSENPVYIEWELSAAIDQEGKQLPGRQVIRDTCLWRYRAWTGAGFDYSKAQCPYTGDAYFDINNLPTTADKDRPSRSLSCCKTRFGENNPLPFGGFPGVGRVQSA